MQDSCHNKPSKYDLARHQSPSSSVVRAAGQCAEFDWLDFRRGPRGRIHKAVLSQDES